VYIIHKNTLKKTKKWYIIVPMPYKWLKRFIDERIYIYRVAILPEILIYGNKFKFKSIMNLINDKQLGM
jgi:hypothetical protein